MRTRVMSSGLRGIQREWRLPRPCCWRWLPKWWVREEGRAKPCGIQQEFVRQGTREGTVGNQCLHRRLIFAGIAKSNHALWLPGQVWCVCVCKFVVDVQLHPDFSFCNCISMSGFALLPNQLQVLMNVFINVDVYLDCFLHPHTYLHLKHPTPPPPHTHTHTQLDVVFAGPNHGAHCML